MRSLAAAVAIAVSLSAVGDARAQDIAGPFNVVVLEGGIGVNRSLPSGSGSATAGDGRILSAWVKPERTQSGDVVIVSVGDAPTDWAVLLRNGRIGVRYGATSLLVRNMASPGRWTHISARLQGTTLKVFVDGTARGSISVGRVDLADKINVAPVTAGGPHFGGAIVDARLTRGAAPASAPPRPNFDLVQMWHVGAGW